MKAGDNGPKWRKIAGWNKKDLDEAGICARYRAGESAQRIATSLGVSIPTITARLKKNGIKIRSNSESHIGQKAWNAKGGHVDKQGYRCIWREGRQVREHRVIAEQMLGRKLLPGEVVHHKNGNRSDNSPENLEVLPSQGHHMKEHMTPEEARRRGKRGGRKKRAALKAVGGAK